MKTRVTLTCASLVALALGACSDDSESTGSTASNTEVNTTVEAVTSVDDTSSPTTDSTDSTTDASTDDSTDITGNIDERVDAAQEALEAGDFTLFLEVLDLSGVADEIRDEERTILAPNDEAFGEMDGDAYADLLTNPTKIDDVIKRHIIEGVITYDELSTMDEVTTMGGETLPVTFVDGVLKIGDATVLEPIDDSVSGEEGQEVVVLEIDMVLLES